MTRRDIIIKWIAYIIVLILLAGINYSLLGQMPIPLPLMLLTAAVAAGTLEGAPFGAGFGIAAGLFMSGLGHTGLGCVPALSAIGWLSGLATQYVLRRDVWGHLICCAGAAALWELWQVGIRLLTSVAPLPILLNTALLEFASTLLLSLPAYWASRFCCIHFGRIAYE